MIFFIIVLVVCILVFFASIIYGSKTYVKAKKNKTLNEDERKKENRSMLFSVMMALFSVIVALYTLFTSVPSPTIYPLNNEARVYDGAAEVSFDTSPLLTTYYSLDGSDPKDGYKYTGKFKITETTTVVAKNRFLYIFWSKPEHSTYRFESVQNTIVTYVDENIDYLSIKQILFLSFIVLAAFYGIIQKIRGER